MTRLYCTSLDNRWAAGIHEGEYLVLTRAEPCQRWEIYDGAESKEDAIQRFLGAVPSATRTLIHDQHIRVHTAGTKWAGRYSLPMDCTVFTLAGYAAKEGYGAEMLASWLADGQRPVSSIARTNVITSNRNWMQQQNNMWDQATVLSAGETVRIDGKCYTVRMVGWYSNPIAFDEVK